MGNFTVDQAEGLRRILGGSRPQLFSFVSTQRGEEKAAMMINLCASLSAAGSDVLLLDACTGSDGIGHRFARPSATLADVAQGKASSADIAIQTPQGFRFATFNGGRIYSVQGDEDIACLDSAFRKLASHAGVVVIDTQVADNGDFALPAMHEGDIVIQVTPSPDSITDAYAAVKRLINQFGRRPFGVLVTGATDDEAARIFSNMSKAASRYLAVSLEFVGSVPADDHLKRAAGLGRPVIDAFPLAGASVAFRRLAQRFAFSHTENVATYGS